MKGGKHMQKDMSNINETWKVKHSLLGDHQGHYNQLIVKEKKYERGYLCNHSCMRNILMWQELRIRIVKMKTSSFMVDTHFTKIRKPKFMYLG